MKLRSHQSEAITNLRSAYRAGARSVIIRIPTGGGKTPIMGEITNTARNRGSRVLLLAHRDNLIRQISETLTMFDIPHGRIQPGQPKTADLVQVGSVQSVIRRLDKLHAFDIILQDECHHVAADNQWARIHHHYPDALKIGMTATPYRLDGKGLGVKSGGIYERIIHGPSVRELVKLGYLVPLKLFGPASQIDPNQLSISGGDFTRSDLDAVMEKPKLIGEAVEHYKKHAPGTRALVFCHSVKVATMTAEKFNENGIRADIITGNDSKDEQKRKISALARREIDVLTSVDVVSEGTDIPAVDCGILMRPTASLSLFLQQCGRIMRTTDGKTHGIILDMVGNIARHGLPDHDFEWHLDPTESPNAVGARKSIPNVKQCQKCFQVFERGNICPHCGHEHEGKELPQTAGELAEIKETEIIRKKKQRQEQGQAMDLAGLLRLCKKRGWKPGRAYIIFQKRNDRSPTREEIKQAWIEI